MSEQSASRDAMVGSEPLCPEPGQLIRRVNQISSALWAQHVGATLTSAQHSVLLALSKVAAMDQVSITQSASLDRSTLADVLVRLEAKQLVKRDRNKLDARRNLVSLTDLGRELLETVAPKVKTVERELVGCFDDQEREAFTALLRRLVAHGEEHLTHRPDGRLDGLSNGRLNVRVDGRLNVQLDGGSDGGSVTSSAAKTPAAAGDPGVDK